MKRNTALDTALSIIDKNIHLDHSEIIRSVYEATGYCDMDYNKFLAITTSGRLTMKDYILKRRLYFAACELVQNSEKSISEIAQDYGYSEQSAFSRAIKREYQKTPSEIRKEHKLICDNKFAPEKYFLSKNKLDFIMDKFETGGYIINCADWDYFEAFIHATEDYGFDIST